MWTVLAQIILVAVGVVHLTPGVVAVAPAKAAAAYGITVDSIDLAVLLRHRAVLLALVGIGLIVGAFVDPLRVAAMVTAAISMGTFVAFAYRSTPNAETRRVARTDVALIAGLAFAAALLIAGSG